METLSIYQYASATQFLKDWLTHQKVRNVAFSIRKWASRTPFSHSLIILMIQGKRSLKARHAIPLSEAMELAPPERNYFQTLVEYENARSPEQRTVFARWLREMNPGQPLTFKEIEEYHLYADWEHMALLSLLRTEMPPRDTDEAFSLLSKARSSNLDERTWRQKIESAWNRLFDLGLVRRDESGQVSVTFTNVRSRDDVQSQGAREHYRQILDLAKNAIEGQSINEREYQIFSLPIESSLLPEIKEEIRSFRERLARKYGAHPRANAVYQFNLNFFRLTECSSAASALRSRARTEDEGAAALTPVQSISEKS